MYDHVESTGVNLDEFVVFFNYLVDLYRYIAVPYMMNASWQPVRSSEPPSFPRLVAIRRGSPLIAELLSPVSEVGALALGVVGYVLKHRYELPDHDHTIGAP